MADITVLNSGFLTVGMITSSTSTTSVPHTLTTTVYTGSASPDCCSSLVPDDKSCPSLIPYKFAIGILVTILAMILLMLILMWCYVRSKKEKKAPSKQPDSPSSRKEDAEDRDYSRYTRVGLMPMPLLPAGPNGYL